VVTGHGRRVLASMRLPRSDDAAGTRTYGCELRNAWVHERLVQAEARPDLGRVPSARPMRPCPSRWLRNITLINRSAQYHVHVTNDPVSWASSHRARAVMLGNRSRDTKPELALRKAMHSLGLRYRVAARPLPNIRRTADIVFPRAQVAIFIDGCFWHGCPKHYVASASNVSYWNAKVVRNKERDRETDCLLRDAGWTVIRIWEHDDAEVAARAVYKLIKESQTP
jgi:DNA mismatch endonuclease (patch repair protein)